MHVHVNVDILTTSLQRKELMMKQRKEVEEIS